jgi:hypothetical protein
MRDLCESAKRGKVCIDDLCRGSSPTLCGFDQDDYDDMVDDMAEPDHDDTVLFCPECERPNQFGELCEACRREDEILRA